MSDVEQRAERIELSGRCIYELVKISGKEQLDDKDVESAIWDSIRAYWTLKNLDNRM